MTEKFEWKYHPRVELKLWLERNFGYFGGNGRKLEDIADNAAQIFDAVSNVMTFTKEHSGPEIVKYYANDLPTIQKAYFNGDMQKFAEAVDSLKDGIEWE